MIYINNTTDERYYGGTLTMILPDGSLFSGIPTDLQLESWGFEEYTEPEPTENELLRRAKELKISELEAYDSSSDVNEFFLGGLSMWLTREERTLIDESIHAYEGTGATEMTKYFGGIPYTFQLTLWKLMLNALIVYASEALNVTEGHKAAVEALTSIDDVEGYDYTTGYPTKLVFDNNQNNN